VDSELIGQRRLLTTTRAGPSIERSVGFLNFCTLDNSFSIHTSKRLTFFVALEERGTKPIAHPSSEMSGWLYKKKRKRMQGEVLD